MLGLMRKWAAKPGLNRTLFLLISSRVHFLSYNLCRNQLPIWEGNKYPLRLVHRIINR